MRFSNYILLFTILLSLHHSIIGQIGSSSFETDCGECQFKTDCSESCGTTTASTVHQLSFGLLYDKINPNHNWAGTNHFFETLNYGTRVIKLFKNHSQSEVADKRIKLAIRDLPRELWLDDITFKRCTILIESRDDLTIKGSISLEEGSLLIIKSTNGKDVTFKGGGNVYVQDNSAFRVYTGGDLIFDKTNLEFRCGKITNGYTDNSHIKFNSADDLQIKATTKFLRYSNSQIEWHAFDAYIVGSFGLSVKHILQEQSGACEDGHRCPFMVKSSQTNTQLITASANVSANLKAGYTNNPGSGGKIVPVDGAITASVEVKANINKITELNHMLDDPDFQASTSWAPKACPENKANFNYDITMKVGNGCTPATLVVNQDNPVTLKSNQTKNELLRREELTSIRVLDPEYFIYPNPVQDFFNIVNSQKDDIKSIEIYAADGKRIFYKHNIETHEYRVDLGNDLNSGTYFLIIENNQGRKITELLSITK